MTTLKINENSEHSLAPKSAASSVDAIVTDSQGRKLTIREPSILDEARLVRAMGDAASNQAFMVGYVLPCAMVTAINGEELFFPMTEMQAEAAIKVVGRPGIAAVMAHVTSAGQERQEAGTADAKK
jgi:hypothetical protein